MRKIMLFLASLVFLLAGCSNIVQQENDTDPSSGGAAGAFLRVTAETEGLGARKEEASARTALPTIDSLTVEDLFTCTLKGTKEGGSEETLVSGVSFEELEGKQIPVTTGRWSFTLTAEKDGTVFKGTCDNKDIGAGDNSLDFLLEWDESALSGTGSLAFSLDWSKAGLGSVEAATGTLFAYDPDTGTETATAYTESSEEISLDMAASTVTYSLSDVPAGVYMIRIAFYSDAEKTSLAGTWRELAVITGGQESGADRVMSVFVKHSATIDPMAAGNLSGITENTISVEGIATLTENIDGTYTLTSQGMGTSVLTFNGTNADGESLAVTYDVSVSDTGELTVGSPEVKTVCTVTFDKNSDEVTGEMPAVLVEKGSDYTIKANKFSLSGYKFAGWATKSDGDKAYDDGATITNVTENLTLYAVWAEIYSVTVAGGIEHGTVTAKPDSAVAGETVTLTVTPESGYAGAIAIKNASDEDISSSVSLSQNSEDTTKWTFTMPEGNVKVTVSFAEPTKYEASISFVDATVNKSFVSSKFKIQVANTGNGDVTYTSSNTAVATVDEKTGEVTIAGVEGTATITATVEDSDTYTYATKEASYTLNVLKYITITNVDYPGTDNFTTSDGLVNVSFSNPSGDRFRNDKDKDGWYFYGNNSTVTVAAAAGNTIKKVIFYTKNGSAELTSAPFIVYSYDYYMYTAPDKGGTCFNDWGVNKIEVYFK